MKTLTNSAIKIVILSLVLVGVLTVNYLQAAWTGPTQSAPGANVAVPINTSNQDQDKAGLLQLQKLQIYDFRPTIILSDYTDEVNNGLDWFIHVNKNRLQFDADEDNNGELNDWPAVLDLNTHFSRFGNEVRAVGYCNEDGTKCLSFDPVEPEPVDNTIRIKTVQSSGAAGSPVTPTTQCPAGFGLVSCTGGLVIGSGAQAEAHQIYPEYTTSYPRGRCNMTTNGNGNIGDGGGWSLTGVCIGGAEPSTVSSYCSVDVQARIKNGGVVYSNKKYTLWLEKGLPAYFGGWEHFDGNLASRIHFSKDLNASQWGTSFFDSGEKLGLGYFTNQEYQNRSSEIDAFSSPGYWDETEGATRVRYKQRSVTINNGTDTTFTIIDRNNREGEYIIKTNSCQ